MARRARQLSAGADRWGRRAGQLVIVDEASMVGTHELDSLTAYARSAGAKVLLVLRHYDAGGIVGPGAAWTGAVRISCSRRHSCPSGSTRHTSAARAALREGCR